MKINIYILALVSVITASCNNTIEPNGNWSDVTVIYGLLDPAADTNWVRVQRGFLGKQNPNLSFSISDSLYYKNITVILESYKILADGGLGSKVDSFVMIKDSTSRTLAPGVFAGDGHYLFRTQEKLDYNLKYKVSVIKHDGGPTASAVTSLVHNPQSQTSGFRFKNPDLTSLYKNEYIGQLEWYAAEGASIYKVDFTFFYKEFDTITEQVEHKHVEVKDFSILTAYNSLEYYSYSPPRNVMYRELAKRIGLPGKHTIRFFEKIKFTIWAASPEFHVYTRVNAPKESINAFVPEVPGIENGTGLFASRTSITLDNIPFHSDVRSSFYLSQALCNRGFAAAQGLDTCFCEIRGHRTHQKCLTN